MRDRGNYLRVICAPDPWVPCVPTQIRTSAPPPEIPPSRSSSVALFAFWAARSVLPQSSIPRDEKMSA